MSPWSISNLFIPEVEVTNRQTVDHWATDKPNELSGGVALAFLRAGSMNGTNVSTRNFRRLVDTPSVLSTNMVSEVNAGGSAFLIACLSLANNFVAPVGRSSSVLMICTELPLACGMGVWPALVSSVKTLPEDSGWVIHLQRLLRP